MLNDLKIKNCRHKRGNTVPGHSQTAAVLYVMRSLRHFPFTLVVVTLATIRALSFLYVF